MPKLRLWPKMAYERFLCFCLFRSSSGLLLDLLHVYIWLPFGVKPGVKHLMVATVLSCLVPCGHLCNKHS